ncbi:MAG: RNA polymerase sigma factor RpoD/SigA [Verrucomicrobiae bacterium]|nr:RNA polymerase sigma factor RpoD/SigA [Verrucomicrobiae bacterium]
MAAKNPPDRDNDDGSSLKIYLREITREPLLKPEEEVALAGKIKKGDQKARAQMIRANLRLVVKIAHDYSAFGLPIQDLISEGNIGLMKAVDRFDPSKGGKLSTYAAWWIKQSIKRALANQSKTIRLPVHVVDKLSQMRRVATKLTDELEREPTEDELAEEMGIPQRKIAQLKQLSQGSSSLDITVGDDDKTALGELVADETVQDPSEIFKNKTLRKDLMEIMDELDERERAIVKARFGLDGDNPDTLEDIGRKFKVTRERIRQIQNLALMKMRKMMSKQDAMSKGEE